MMILIKHIYIYIYIVLVLVAVGGSDFIGQACPSPVIRYTLYVIIN